MMIMQCSTEDILSLFISQCEIEHTDTLYTVKNRRVNQM